jgi:hypothetical protein
MPIRSGIAGSCHRVVGDTAEMDIICRGSSGVSIVFNNLSIMQYSYCVVLIF